MKKYQKILLGLLCSVLCLSFLQPVNTKASSYTRTSLRAGNTVTVSKTWEAGTYPEEVYVSLQSEMYVYGYGAEADLASLSLDDLTIPEPTDDLTYIFQNADDSSTNEEKVFSFEILLKLPQPDVSSPITEPVTVTKEITLPEILQLQNEDYFYSYGSLQENNPSKGLFVVTENSTIINPTITQDFTVDGNYTVNIVNHPVENPLTYTIVKVWPKDVPTSEVGFEITMIDSTGTHHSYKDITLTQDNASPDLADTLALPEGSTVWSYTVVNLPSKDAAGNPLQYDATELIDLDYQYTKSEVTTEDGTTYHIFTNTLKSEPESSQDNPSSTPENPSSSTPQNSSPAENNVVKTGDSSSLAIWIALVLCCAALAAGLTASSKRRKEEHR